MFSSPSSLEVLRLLHDVSRSFYLTLRVLPEAIRPQIGLAYLLARATDTIADTEVLTVEERLAALDRMRSRILGRRDEPLDLAAIANAGGPGGSAVGVTAGERLVLLRIEEAIGLLAGLSSADQELVRQVLSTITGGQESDLRRFGRQTRSGDSRGLIACLEDDNELDDYTYRVAGCVGEFWTRMCRSHLFPDMKLDDEVLLKTGVRFGKGLQLVNVLRDLPKDLRLGRCYIPRTALEASGLAPEELLDARNMDRFRSTYDRHLDLAQGYLADGWAYTLALPSDQARVRLACAWPLLIGARTLARLRDGNVLDATRRIKIRRGEVRWLIVQSVVLHPWPGVWRGLFERATAVGRLKGSGGHQY